MSRRPKQRFAYEPTADLAAVATAYVYGLVHNHPYNDGNRRGASVRQRVRGEVQRSPGGSTCCTMGRSRRAVRKSRR
ncbi:Fic family protein [Thioalkalivibrio sp.]|uniref:Fic family protein n=1 Tax=Thioalkalivibrio sp. TaxID=2093813 RepID=UPI0012D59E03|nr:MAG: hypothetical protein EA346_12940 [Thioalkalivibrio sp.]